ncbi:hypothetical protein STZ1_50027 [Bacillus subtilis]
MLEGFDGDQIDEHKEALQNTLSISSVAAETSLSKGVHPPLRETRFYLPTGIQND